jgi:hypothetical protein
MPPAHTLLHTPTYGLNLLVNLHDEAMGFPLSTPTGSTGSTPTSSSTKKQTEQNRAVDMSFTIEEKGKPNTLDYRVFFSE